MFYNCKYQKTEIVKGTINLLLRLHLVRMQILINICCDKYFRNFRKNTVVTKFVFSDRHNILKISYAFWRSFETVTVAATYSEHVLISVNLVNELKIEYSLTSFIFTRRQNRNTYQKQCLAWLPYYTWVWWAFPLYSSHQKFVIIRIHRSFNLKWKFASIVQKTTFSYPMLSISMPYA